VFDEKQIVFLEESFTAKEDVIRCLTHLENSRIVDADRYEQAVLEREASFATYTIDGVAMPHAKSEGVGEAFVTFARLNVPVPWGAEPGEDARIVFLIGVPQAADGEQNNNLHLKILAALSKKLIHESFRQKLSDARSETEVYQLLQEIEEDF
jgi:PTS family fructose porter, IIA component